MSRWKIVILMIGSAEVLARETATFADMNAVRAHVTDMLRDWMNDDDRVRHFKTMERNRHGKPLYQCNIVAPEGGDPSDIIALYAEIGE